MLADILAGPILRRLTEQQLVLWWLSPYECQGEFCCFEEDEKILTVELTSDNLSTFRVGEYAVVHLLDIDISLPSETYLEYDLLITATDKKVRKPLSETVPHITYDNCTRPSFIIQSTITNLLHGSCRNPHNSSGDSLLVGDKKVADALTDVTQRPSLLMMNGDQIYADHVAGATLYAIHQVIELLGLYGEKFTNVDFVDEENHPKDSGISSGISSAKKSDNNKKSYQRPAKANTITLTDSEQLYQLTDKYFKRENVLPRTTLSSPWYSPSSAQPIFTSTYAHNHLITFAEMMAMYLLVWSPTLWQEVELTGFSVPAEHEKTHQNEVAALEGFIEGLANVQRLLAHIPTYMIFDDHDVTDDWNLTAQWEQAVYENPLAKRIIGNSLFAYWLCQGWGNEPKNFKGDFWQMMNNYQQSPNAENQDNVIDYLLGFSQWQYTVDTSPKLVVLDSRTRRWRSEQSLAEPSGLMDWEALCELQQELIGHDAILLASPAPIFGVKVIETIQRMATIIGKPLAVDAENWMAHSGSASTILNIFKHPKTPQHFVILSGDVHYSFVYDIELRFSRNSPKIWQITSSGIKNQFPQPLIGILDRLNRVLYGPYSPLNLFTKRRAMRVTGRKLVTKNESGDQKKHKPLSLGHQRLMPKAALGYLELNEDGSPEYIADLHPNGSITEFIESDEELMH
ncbi:alkaline phosphatase D family protein [Colwellia asteriadis]|uniref:Alkaline phosphatase D family protein n=1 Tax=Colwellia asteriadis TaxID=517723 RepID=A0ABN1L9I0_9GAMM